jgi:hypothetical protein
LASSCLDLASHPANFAHAIHGPSIGGNVEEPGVRFEQEVREVAQEKDERLAQRKATDFVKQGDLPTDEVELAESSCSEEAGQLLSLAMNVT